MGEVPRVVSRRALKVLGRPDSFLKYVLVRADVAGFPVTPARMQDLARALSSVSPEVLRRQGIDPLLYYREIFAAVLAQDPESYESFKKFWDDLWFTKYDSGGSGGGGGGSGIDRLVTDTVDRIARKMAGGVYSLPPEVIEE